MELRTIFALWEAMNARQGRSTVEHRDSQPVRSPQVGNRRQAVTQWQSADGKTHRHYDLFAVAEQMMERGEKTAEM